MRAGAGMVQLSMPGHDAGRRPDRGRAAAAAQHAAGPAPALDVDSTAFTSLVVGPGLGRSDDTAASVRKLVVEAPLPMVVDGDGLFALGVELGGRSGAAAPPHVPTVLTPHDGEYALLAGQPPGADRMVAARTAGRRQRRAPCC